MALLSLARKWFELPVLELEALMFV